MAGYDQVLIPMKNRVLVFGWVLASSVLYTAAQTKVDLQTQGKSVDFTGASSTKPIKAGTALPATCSVGEFYFLTDAPPGANVYVCSATDVWTGAGVARVFSRTGDITAQSGDYAFSQIGGIAGKSQLPSTAMYTDSAQNSAGFMSSATNWIGFDSAANKWHIWDGQDGTLPVLHANDAILIQGGVRSQPAIPSSGQAALYINSTDKKIHSVDDAGLDTAYGTGGGTLTIANAGTTGTTLNTLTKLTGAPSTALIAATTDTGGVVGITTAGAGTTGSATIQQAGPVNCVFDGATTAGDYVQISSGTRGFCHDAGVAYPSSAQVIGRVLSTNASAGTFGIDLFPAEIRSTANLFVKGVGSGYIQPFGHIAAMAGVNIATTTRWFQFVAPFNATVNTAVLDISTAVASSNVRVAVYSDPCTTSALLQQTANMPSTSTGPVYGVFGSALSLSPGVYWVAVASDTTGVGIYAGGTTVLNLMVNETSHPRFATGNNATGSGGSFAMPTGCGTLTASSAIQEPALLFLP
jgi:hypothetical protein